MIRLLGIAGAMLLTLLILVPGVAAAEPWNWGRTENLIIASGTDITLSADQDVDTLVIVSGHARIEGHAGTIFVLGGTAELVGARTGGIVAIQANVNIDAATVVTGDVRSMDSIITGASPTTVAGRIRDIGPDMALGWMAIGSVLFFVYLAFAISVLFAGIVVAGLAGRQVREATALISTEPLPVLAAALIGLIGLVTAAIVAMITVVGIPFGLGLLLLVLPALFVIGYIVVGIWLGEAILARTSPGVVRERPYFAAVVGLTILGIVSILPPIGGLISLVGMGAVVLLMWRVVRRSGTRRPVDRSAQSIAQAVG